MARDIFGQINFDVDEGASETKQEKDLELKPKAKVVQQKGTKESDYGPYSQAVNTYVDDLNKEKEALQQKKQAVNAATQAFADMQQLEKKKEVLNVESQKFYKESVARAEGEYNSLLSSKQHELLKRKQALISATNDQKSERFKQVTRKELEISKQEHQMDTTEAQMKQNLKALESQSIGDVNSIMGADPKYQSVAPIVTYVNKKVVKNGFNSYQKKFMNGSIENLAQSVQNKEALFSLVNMLQYSVFYKKISNEKVSEDKDAIGVFAMFVQMAFLLIFLIGAIAAAGFGAYGLAAFSMGMIVAGMTYFMLQFAAKFIGITARESVFGIAIWGLALLFGCTVGTNMGESMSNSIPGLGWFIYAVVASFVPAALIKQKYVARLICQFPFVRTIAVMGALNNADKLESKAVDKKESQLSAVLLQSNNKKLVSLMICATLRFPELYEFLCNSEIEYMKADIANRIKKQKDGLMQIEAGRKNLAAQKQELANQKQAKEYLDKEADKKLAEDIQRLEAEFGNIQVPDFEQNISARDRVRIEKYRVDIQNCQNAIVKAKETCNQCQKVVKAAENTIEQVREDINKMIGTIKTWTGTATVADADGKLFDDICLENKNMPTVRPTMIEHKTHPLLFSYDEWSAEGALELVYRLWQSFGKRNANELLDMYVVDPDGMIASDLAMDVTHYDMLPNIRNGFQTEEVLSSEKGRMLYVLSDRRDIENLEKKIQNQQNNLMKYVQENTSRFAQISASNQGEMIELVNKMRQNETGVSVFPYAVVFILVPQEGAQFVAELPDSMLHRIARDNGYKAGFVPVLIASDKSCNRKWTGLVDSIAQKYHVDLNTTVITKK